MRTFWILWKRETATYFRTPLALVLLVSVLLLTGFNFYASVSLLNHGPTAVSIVEAFFNALFFWGTLLFIAPLLTMRLFAEEYRSGTLETLMTAPVSETQVVLAKFFGALFLFAILWIPSILYFVLFWPSAHQVASASHGAYCGAYGMLLLQGMFYLSIGCLASALTSHQLIAGIISFCVMGLLFSMGLLASLLHLSTPLLDHLIAFFSPMEAMKMFSRGLIDTRPIVLYLSLTLFFLFLTLKIFQLRRAQSRLFWRFLLQLISVLCLVVGINLVSARHFCHYDISRSHRFSLSEQGSVLFSGINQPAHIIIYFSPTSLTQESELYGDLEALMKEYQIKARENLIVEYLDPARNLTRAREVQAKYKFNPNENVVVIDYLNRSTVIPVKNLAEYETGSAAAPRLVAFRGEQVINGALIGLSGVPLKKVYFLQGHGEMTPGLPPLEIIGRYLQWQNITPALLNLGNEVDVPEDASLLVIAGAQVDLSETEVTALKNYWKRSGRLLILLDPTADTPLLNSIPQEEGITPRRDRVLRTTTLGSTTTIVRDVTGAFIPGSEFTKQFLNLNILFLGTTQSLAVADSSADNAEVQVRPLIEALYGFWGSSDPGKEIAFQPERDTLYPVIIAAMADRGALHDDRVALHASRMVVVGNADFIKDASLGEVGLDFFSSSLNELIDRISLAGNTAKMKAYYTLNVSEEEMNRIALWCLLLIPMATAFLGSILLWKRYRSS